MPRTLVAHYPADQAMYRHRCQYIMYGRKIVLFPLELGFCKASGLGESAKNILMIELKLHLLELKMKIAGVAIRETDGIAEGRQAY